MISIWILLPMIVESSGTKTCMNNILKIIAIICSLHLDSYITPSSPAVSKKTFCCKPTNWLDLAGIHIYNSERLCLSLQFFGEGMPSSPKLPSAPSVMAMQIFCSAGMGFGKPKGIQVSFCWRTVLQQYPLSYIFHTMETRTVSPSWERDPPPRAAGTNSRLLPALSPSSVKPLRCQSTELFQSFSLPVADENAAFPFYPHRTCIFGNCSTQPSVLQVGLCPAYDMNIRQTYICLNRSSKAVTAEAEILASTSRQWTLLEKK